MVFFFYQLSQKSIPGYLPLYWLLIVTFAATFGKVLYEWYHYLYITVPPTPPTTKTYTVDIFTTFCAGEPYQMIVETLNALQAITYPHTTYLCDEANDAYLKGVCQKLGVNHITRTDKTDAKAGNINNALKYSTGELCVVLDPDHVPFPEFLDDIVSHFNDPGIGFVQIVQAYRNHDQTLIAKGAAQQTYQFYGPMMMCMNSYGTVLAIGANCTFRRSALDSIGGHAAGLAEDMHTAIQLHAKGWKSVYVPRVLARGLVPATLSAYYKQQLKWSRGVAEIAVTSYPKLFSKLTWKQRLHYGLIPLYYLAGILYLVNFLMPVISLFANIYPIEIYFTDFLLLSLPFLTCTIIIRHYVQQWVMEDTERGFHVIGGLLLIGSWWVFNLGLIYTIIRKKVPYIPTPKDDSEEKNFWINVPNATVLIVSAVAILYGLHYNPNPFTFVMVGIASVNCLVMLFILTAGKQLQFRKFKQRHPNLQFLWQYLTWLKIKLWLLRRRVYGSIRYAGLFIIVLIAYSTIYIDGHPGMDQQIKPLLTNNVPATYKINNNTVERVYDENRLPAIKILRPALTTVYKNILTYHALIKKRDKWIFARADNTNLFFEWYLIKRNGSGVPLFIRKLGAGPSINVNMPLKIDDFKLYLICSSGSNVSIVQSTLNLPL